MKSFFAIEIAKDREILMQLIKRDVYARYKGSLLGIVWAGLQPIMMLSVYTLVFSQVFKGRWDGIIEDNRPTTFALNLFAGLIVFNIFAECTSKSPTIITNNPNYVKKIVFPIHALGGMLTGSAFAHGLISAGILILAKGMIDNSISSTVILIPIVWIPFLLQCLGLTWLMSCLGVFIKDTGQIVNAFISMLMFLSPIFYPSSALPGKLMWMTDINPLVFTIDRTREIMIYGIVPNWEEVIIAIILSTIWCQMCFMILRKSHRSLAEKL